MAEESDLEKTEPASPERLEKARQEGQVARSRELVTFVMLVTALGGLWVMGDSISLHFGNVFRTTLHFERMSAFDPPHMMNLAGNIAANTLLALMPLMIMMLIAALVAPMMLGGWLLSTKSLAPKFSKLNPIAGIGRMFSTESLAELVKTIVKSLLIGSIAWWVISAKIDAIMSLMSEPTHAALSHSLRLVAGTCALIVGSLLLVVLIDVPYQLWSHAQTAYVARRSAPGTKRKRRRPPGQGTDSTPATANGQTPHDGRSTQGRHHHHQPNPFCCGLEVHRQRNAGPPRHCQRR